MREKRRLFKIYITDKNERSRKEYRDNNREVKIVTRQKKNEVDERDGIQLSKKFRKKKTLFWSDVNMKRKERDQKSI